MAIKQATIQAADYGRNVFLVNADEGVGVTELLNPAYWAHVAAKLHKGDHIEVFAMDAAFFAELIVMATGATWATVAVLNHVDLSKASKPDAGADEYYVKWSAPSTKFRVHRKSDKEVLADGFATAALANEWLEKFKAEHFKNAA